MIRSLIFDSPKTESTHTEFCKGAFVTHNTTHRISTMAHDQIQEQLNAIIKEDGGFNGLTESPQTLRSWEVASPEVTRILTEVETKQTNSYHHHETANTQKRF